MTLAEEKLLVERAKKDSLAFGQLYDEHYSRIFGYVLKRTADLDLTQDVVSETFLKALKNLNQFHWQNVSFSSWLFRIASNEIVNFWRKKKPALSFSSVKEPAFTKDLSEEIMAAQDKLKDHQDFLMIQKQIRLLDSRYQEVIVLRFFEKKSLLEIAEILGKKEGTVKSLLHRGLEKLRKNAPPLEV